MKCDIVIVNWNSGKQLEDCVESIRIHHEEMVEKCIVVDNGSTDGSAVFLSNAEDVDIVLTGRNLGFGAACNLGATRGDSPFLLFLNPDTCLKKGSLSGAANFMRNAKIVMWVFVVYS